MTPNLHNLQQQLRALRDDKKLLLQNGDEGFATAPSNIALIKYWGKKENCIQIPQNSSISYTLGAFRSFTKVTVLGRFFSEAPYPTRTPHQIALGVNAPFIEASLKTQSFLNSLLSGWADEISLRISTYNNFPTGCGIASSASGFAALVAAIADLLQLNKHFNDSDLQYWLAEWARLGSGSATRSAMQNNSKHFVAWKLLSNNALETQTQCVPVEQKLADNFSHCVVVVNAFEKKISSSAGHELAGTSILHPMRVAGAEKNVELVELALKNGDFNAVQTLAESDAFAMHAVMLTGNPPQAYFTNVTSSLIANFIAWRNANNISAFWTLDAGPNLHICYLQSQVNQIKDFLRQALPNANAQVFWGEGAQGLVMGKKEYQNMSQQQLLKVQKI